MFAVGVDVSNGRNMVAVLGVRRKVVMKPFEVPHTADGFASLSEKLNGLDGETRIVMEHTGRYYESFAMSMYRAGFFVSAVNPLAIKDYQEGISVRKVKTDKADALKIAQFAIDKWEILPQYTPKDTIRYNLKTLHRQFQLSSKTKTALNNNLIALLEQSYPGANRYFDSPVRPDGSQKWVDFVDTFWHVDCVARVSQKAFVERYRKWCKRHGYNFSEQKAIEIHMDARQKFPLVPKTDTCKLLVKETVSQLNAVSRTVEAYRTEMDRLASQLPEYDTVMAMTGVGKSMGPQLMAEISQIDLKDSTILADRAYGKWEFREFIANHDADFCIPPRKDNTDPWYVDWWLYKERHLVETFFLKLKEFRRVATRFDKLASRFLAFVHLACIRILLA